MRFAGFINLHSYVPCVHSNSDALLCHDDELEGRRIAFIWYLVPKDWDGTKDGGFLQLFSCQKDNQEVYRPNPHSPPARLDPWKIHASLSPRRNQFAFFEVSAYSFHQVRFRIVVPLPHYSPPCSTHIGSEGVMRWRFSFQFTLRFMAFIYFF